MRLTIRAVSRPVPTIGAACCTGGGRFRQKFCTDSPAGPKKSISTCTAHWNSEDKSGCGGGGKPGVQCMWLCPDAIKGCRNGPGIWNFPCFFHVFCCCAHRFPQLPLVSACVKGRLARPTADSETPEAGNCEFCIDLPQALHTLACQLGAPGIPKRRWLHLAPACRNNSQFLYTHASWSSRVAGCWIC